MAQESLKIESKDLSVEDLFKDFYTVPDFQREYVWERTQVERLLQDILDEFYDEEGQNIKGPEYFLGSIVVCHSIDGTMSLIDGQQRMTTIFLVLCAIRDLLVELQEKPNSTLLSQIAFASNNEYGEEIFSHRLVLQYDDSKDILKTIVETPNQLKDVTPITISVKRIQTAYADIVDFLRVNCDSSPSKLKLFYASFTKRIKLIRIITPSLANALKVFETINDRGVGLNAMDLLKNLLFMKTTQADYPQLKQNWEVLIKTLDGCREKPLRFLRYFIMSQNVMDQRKPLREDDIYDWFVDNMKLIELDTKPMALLKRLIECSQAWSNFMDSKDTYGEMNPYLKNLSLLSGAARQHFILLLAGRKLSQELFSKLCRGIENLFFCYIITREPTKTFERNFAVWSVDLRNVTDDCSLDVFLKEKFTADLLSKREAFDFAFQSMKQSSIQQYRMKYILAKITQYIEKQAWKNPAHTNLDQYIASTVEIEHILPQRPNEALRLSFDKQDQYDMYVEKLGNLTLLEKTINASVSNDSFDKKKPGYQQSEMLLTRSIAEKPNVGENTQLNRAVKELSSFEYWNSETIESRQTMLAKLALSVWDMPDRYGENEERER